MIDMKELLTIMFNGWKIHRDSWDEGSQTHGVGEEEAMIQACNGDEKMGCLLKTFDHWEKDIISQAAHYGIGFNEDNEIIEIPPAPSWNHYWYKGAWHESMEEELEEEGS